MKIEVKKEFWIDGVFIDVLDTDMAFRLEGITSVRLGCGAGDAVSVRFYRVSDLVCLATFPADEVVKLVADLKLEAVIILGQIEMQGAA